MTKSRLECRATASARTSFGVFACLCFLFQQWLIPVHLALHEHHEVAVPDLEMAAHTHEPAHAAHHHHHHGPPSHVADDVHERDHEPHPAEDHLDDGSSNLVTPAFGNPVPALGLTADDVSMTPASAEGVISREIRSPRAPPPRRAPSPRAPPFVI